MKAENILYRLHNSGRAYPVSLFQLLANRARREGSKAMLVLCYCDGFTNGR